MKRIFLTSGLVLCMACPAFAEGNVFTATSGELAGECAYDELDTFTGPVNLRAIWTADDYTLQYSPNTPATTAQGQTNTVTNMPSPDTVTLTYDDPYTVSAAPSLTGYQFNGWLASTALNDNAPAGNIYSGGYSIDRYKATGAQTMIAQWTPNQYDVKYSDGTTVYTDQDGAIYDANYVALDIASTTIEAPEGHTFIGWSETANPTVTRGAANGTTPVNTGTVDGGAWTGETPWRIADDNKTVYAAFLANQYNITYSCTGGELDGNTGNADGVVGKATGNAPANTLVTYGQSYTLAGNTCELKGYIFAGWSCPDLTGNDVNVDTHTGYFNPGQSDGKWTGTANVTCTAKWKPGTITGIQWDDNGATTASVGGDTSCTYDDSIVLPTAPEKTGYTFGGWEVVPQPSQQ